MLDLEMMGRAPRERAKFRRGVELPTAGYAQRISSGVLRLAVGLFLCLASPHLAVAGPNEGGMLVVHIDESIIYSRGVNCDIDLRDCAQAVTSIAPDPDRIVVLFLLASFPFSPEVAGMVFGIDYATTIVGYGQCGDDFELPHEGWPASGSGTALTFIPPITRRVFPVYWFAVYAEDGGYFYVTEHPHHGANFADSSVPAQIDDVAGFGWAGFGLTGYNPCLEGVPIGACCLVEGDCIVTTESACRLQDGFYRGDDIPCEAFACVGPCCLDDVCQEVTQIDCERTGGEWGERPGAPCGEISCLRENVSWGVLKYHHRN